MKRVLVVLFLLCVVAGCTTDSQLTTSGSESWSRGAILGTTEQDLVAVAAWDDETFVAWFGEGGSIRLAHLDAAMSIVDTTSLSLTADLPRDMRLIAAADQLHLTWIDTIDRLPTLVYARVEAGQGAPSAHQLIPLTEDARRVEALLSPEEQRLDVFWSDLPSRTGGLYHRAFSLEGEELATAVSLTETGWQPGAARDEDGLIHLAWTDEGADGYAAVWYAQFDPQPQSLQGQHLVAEARMRRGVVIEEPEVGAVAGVGFVAWNTGDRRPVIVGSGDVPWGTEQIGGQFGSAFGVSGSVEGDQLNYAAVPPAVAEPSPVHSLVHDPAIGAYGAPRVYSAEGQVWAVYSGWVARHSMSHLQVMVISLGEEGSETPTPVTGSQSRSLYPDLAAEGDTLRVAWLELLGEETYQVVVASTGSTAREALGDFLWSEWWQEVALIGMDAIGLLGFLPLVLAWTVLPLGLVLVATWVSGGELPGLRAALWLGGAVILQMVCKGFIAAQLSPFQADLVQAALGLIPFALGAGAMLLYWKRAESPVLIIAFALFAGVDAAYSLFILLPSVLWST